MQGGHFHERQGKVEHGRESTETSIALFGHGAMQGLARKLGEVSGLWFRLVQLGVGCRVGADMPSTCMCQRDGMRHGIVPAHGRRHGVRGFEVEVRVPKIRGAAEGGVAEGQTAKLGLVP